MNKKEKIKKDIKQIIEKENLSNDEKLDLFSEIFTENIDLDYAKNKILLGHNTSDISKKDDLNIVQNKIIGIPLEAILIFIGENNV